MKAVRCLLPAILLLSAGCIKVDETLSINKDGSGSLEINYSLSEQFIIRLGALEKLVDEMAEAAGEKTDKKKIDGLPKIFLNPTEEGLKSRIKKAEEHGVKLDSLKIESRGEWRHIAIKLSFKNIADLAKTELFPAYGFSLSRNRAGDYELFHASQTKADKKVKRSAGKGKMSDEEKLLMPVFTGFKVVLRIYAPARIQRSNATRSSVYRAEWIYDYDRDPKAFSKLREQDFMVLFEGRGLNLPVVKQK